MHMLRVAILGSGGVGKSTFIKRYNQSYGNSPRHQYTHEELRMTKGIDIECCFFEYNSVKYTLQIFDFGGQKQFRFFLPLLLNKIDIALYFFDLQDYETFLDLQQIIPMTRESIYSSHLAEILVGNKLDQQREVLDHDISPFLSSFNLIEYCEISSKERINLAQPFNIAIQRLLLLNNNTSNYPPGV